MSNVLGPRLAPDVYHNTIGRLRKLHHHQRRPVALLVQIRVVVDWKSLRREVLDRPDVLLVDGVFPLAGNADVAWVPAAAELVWPLGFVERFWHPVKDLVEFEEDAGLTPIVPIVTLPCALCPHHVDEEATGSVARTIFLRKIFAVDQRLRFLHPAFTYLFGNVFATT